MDPTQLRPQDRPANPSPQLYPLLGVPSVHGGTKSADAALGDAFNTKTETNAPADGAGDGKDPYDENGEDEVVYRPANPAEDNDDQEVYRPANPTEDNDDQEVYRTAAADAADRSTYPHPLTDEEYKSLEVAGPPSSQKWNPAVDAIRAARGGLYPPDWFVRILSDPAKFPMPGFHIARF
mgnify:CR=1 FL=1